jgi:hypothetical protein
MRTPEAASNMKGEEAARGVRSGLEELQRLRREQIEMLAHAAADDPVVVNGFLARVQSLTAAIDLLEKSKSTGRNRRFAIIAWAVAVLLTGTLLLLHRPSVEVLVDAKSSQMAFTVTTPFAPLRGLAQVASVEMPGLAKIRQEGAPEIAAAPDEDLLRLRVQPDTASGSPGSIGFDSLLIPAGTQVEFAQTGAANTVELRFQYPSGSSPALDLDVAGDVLIRLQGRRKASFRAPVRITAIPAGDARLVVDFGSRDVTYDAPFPVSSVSWSQDIGPLSLHPGGAREESSILSARVSLEEFKDRSINLRNGESLHLGGLSGQIRQLRSDGEAFVSQFDGSAKSLSTGEGNRKQNLMPTWLDWLRHQDALVQFWAVAGYLAAMGLTIGRWWRDAK